MLRRRHVWSVRPGWLAGWLDGYNGCMNPTFVLLAVGCHDVWQPPALCVAKACMGAELGPAEGRHSTVRAAQQHAAPAGSVCGCLSGLYLHWQPGPTQYQHTAAVQLGSGQAGSHSNAVGSGSRVGGTSAL
jgi:hypothetical protein